MTTSRSVIRATTFLMKMFQQNGLYQKGWQIIGADLHAHDNTSFFYLCMDIAHISPSYVHVYD